MRLVTLLAACLSLGGCMYSGQFLGRPAPITEQTAEFDRAVATSDRQMILQNILRARDRESLSFSRLSQVRGSMTRQMTTGVNATLNEGAGNDVLVPSISMTGSSTPSFDFPVQNTQQFNRAIHNAVDVELVDLLLRQDWQPGLVYMMLVQEMTLDCALMESVYRRHLENASYPSYLRHGYPPELAAELRAAHTHCTTGARDSVTLFNSPMDWAAHEQFYRWLRILLRDESAHALSLCSTEEAEPFGPPLVVAAAGNLQHLVAAAQVRGLSVDHTDGEWRLRRDKARRELRLGCGEPFLLAVGGDAVGGADSPRSHMESAAIGQSDVHGSIEIRSIEGMIYFLGEVARVERRSREGQYSDSSALNAGATEADGLLAAERDRQAHQVLAPAHALLRQGYERRYVPDADQERLFVLRDGSTSRGVTVNHHRRDYHVAYTEMGCPSEEGGCGNSRNVGDRSQQVIEMVLQLLGMLQQREDLPITPAVATVR